ncbi:DNA/RNA-binding protein Alba [uncultured archaeon]|nr:DNA/RNA-binding protein Alba [uncultured archaeon]
MPNNPDNAILIGSKPLMSYVLAVVTQLGNGKKEILIKARGNAISKAVDVAELLKNKFAPGTTIADIKTATEQMKSHDGRDVGVSTIAILIKKPA